MKGFMKKTVVLAAVSLIFAGLQFSPVYAYQAPETIRIGLETVCKNVNSATIQNAEVLVGAEVNGKFLEGATVSYPAGFTVVPSSVSYTAVSGSMDFNAAKALATELEGKGLTASPAFLGESGWTVYVSGAAVEQVVSQSGRSAVDVGADSNRVELKTSGKTAVVSGNGIILQFQAKDNQGIMNLNGNQYRGRLEFSRKAGGGVTAVNVVPMDDYLCGVVPAEMAASFEVEALKAQAVAARTYSMTKLKAHGEAYQLCDKTHCQVYKGAAVESERTNQAVKATSGKVICYNGQPIEAVFCAASGGYTEDTENVWNEPVPYLRGVKEINEVEQKSWSRTYTVDDINTLLRAKGETIGSVSDIVITKLSSGGRIAELQIVGTSGVKVLEKDAVRTYFSALPGGSLPSKLFTINGKGGSTIAGKVYTGQGDAETMVQYAANTLTEQSLTDSAATFGITMQASGTQTSELDGQRIEVKGLEKVETTPENPVSTPQTTPQDTAKSSADKAQKELSVTQSVNISTSNGSTFVFEGKGNGHGVGMSQWGANGMASIGYTYEQILKQYYTGVTIE